MAMSLPQVGRCPGARIVPRCKGCGRCGRVRGLARGRMMYLVALAMATATSFGASRTEAAQLAGVLGAHDPSPVVQDGSSYYYFATGQGIVSRNSTDLVNWNAGPSVFSTAPAWTSQA